MFSIREYADKLNAVKTRGRVVSNNFLSVSEKENCARDKNSVLVCTDDTVAILVVERDFYRLYFETVNLEDIGKITDSINGTIVTEYVGVQPSIDLIDKQVEKSGFNRYSSLTRWKCNKIIIDSTYRDGNISFMVAVTDDLTDIQSLFVSIFDNKVSHLPDDSKLQKLIGDNLVYVAKDDEGTVVGIICFEKVGSQGLYLYQVCVDSEYHGRGIAYSLACFAYSQYIAFKQFISWVEDSNVASQALHKKLGFVPDRLKTMVYVKK